MKNYHISLLVLMTFFNVTIATSQVDYNDVAEIFYNNCSDCHRDGGIAPFPISSYDEAVAYDNAISTAVGDHAMPPWQPNSDYKDFMYNTMLTDAEIALIQQWVADGSLEGNPAIALPSPVCPDEQRPNKLAGEADLTVSMGEKSSPVNGFNSDPYNCYVVDLNMTEGRWLRAVEIKPTNYAMIHHVVISADTSDACSDNTSGACYTQCGDFYFAIWTPGAEPLVFPHLEPAKLGMWIPAGTKLVMQVHFAPTSAGESGDCLARLYFYDQDSTQGIRQVTEEVLVETRNFTIAANSVVQLDGTDKSMAPNKPDRDLSIFGAMPHAHTANVITTQYATDGSADTVKLIQINDWDQNWEGYYFPKNLIKVPSTYDLVTNKIYDNTANNPNLISDPNNSISWGTGTADEMLFDSYLYTDYVTGDENIDLEAIIEQNQLKSKPPVGRIEEDKTVCQNASNITLTLIGTEGTPPYSFTYNVNGGSYQTVSTGDGVNDTSVSVSVATNNLGSFVYTLATVGDKNNCSKTMRDTVTVIVNSGPSATITGETTVCKDATSPVVTFKAADGSAPYDITYTINNGAENTATTGAGDSVTVSVPTNTLGDFVYALVSVDDGNCEVSATGDVTVTVTNGITGSIAGDATVCQGATSPAITFTGTGGSPPYSFTYTIDGGSSQLVSTTGGSSSVTVDASTTSAGTYTYALTNVSDNNNSECSSASGSVDIVVEAGPTASAGGTETICASEPATVSGATSANGTIAWTHDGDGSLSSATTTTPTYTSTTNDAGNTVTLTMTVTGTGECTSETETATYSIIVEEMPTASAGGSETICANASATVSGASSANGTISWSHDGAGSLSSGTTLAPTYNPEAADNGNTVVLTMTVSSDNSCDPSTATATYSVTVDDASGVTGTISGSATVCTNDASPNLTFTGDGGTPPYTFTYTLNNGANQTVTTNGSDLSVTVAASTSAAGTFTYDLIDISDNGGSSSCSSASGSEDIVVNEGPTAGAGGSETICEGEIATVSGASSNGTNSWTHNGNGTLSNETTLTPTYSAVAADAGNTVTLTLSVVNSCSSTPATATFSVVVNADPVANADAGSNAAVCVNNSITIDDASASSGTISWTHNGNGTVSSGNTLEPTYTADQTDGGNTVTLTLSVTNTNNCGSVTATSTVAISIEANSNSPVVCPPVKPNITYTNGTLNTTSNEDTYQWYKGGVPISGANSQSYNPTENGSYTLVVSNQYGSSLASDAISVNDQGSDPPAKPTITNNGGVLTSSASTGNQWYKDGVLIQGETGSTFTPTSNGTYTTIASNGNGDSPPSDPYVVTNLGNAPDKPIITNNSGVLSSSASTGNQWYKDGTLIPGATGSTYTPIENGSYTVVESNGNGSSPASDPAVITNITTLTKPIITNNGGTLSSNYSAGNQWYLNGDPISGATSATYTPTENGTYTLVVTSGNVTSEASDPEVITNITSPPTKPIITNTEGVLTSNYSSGNQWYLDGLPISGATGISFTPIKGGVYTLIVTNSGGTSVPSDIITVTLTSIDVTNARPVLSIYPNPASSTVTVNLNTPITNGTLSIVNLLGTDVKSLNFDGTKLTFDIDDITTGVYFIMIKQDQNIIAVEKLIVETH